MPTSEENKAIVGQFLANGVSSDASIVMVTDDFRWTGPRSMEFMFEGGHELVGGESLRVSPTSITRSTTGYQAGPQRLERPLHDRRGRHRHHGVRRQVHRLGGRGVPQLLLPGVRARDGKIAEVREHADTKYVWDTLLATPGSATRSWVA